jgi:hypothetical protein
VAEIYAIELPATAVVAGLVGFAIFLARRGPAPVGRALWLVAMLVVAAAFVSAAVHGARLLPGLRLGAEEALLAFVPLVVWGGIAMLTGELAAPVSLTAAAALQLYPRADFVHLMPLGPLLIPLALRLWSRGDIVVGALPRAVLVAIPLALAVARFAPTATTLARLAGGDDVPVRVGSTEFLIEGTAAEPLRALAAAVDAARAASTPGASMIAFPACGLVPFFARLTPAGPHDYFFPGRPSRAEAKELASRLASAPPPLAVTCDVAGSELSGAWSYYPELANHVVTHYPVLVTRPPFTVRRHDD